MGRSRRKTVGSSKFQLLAKSARREFRDFVNHTHSAFTQLLEDLVVTYGCTDHFLVEVK